jgi:multiple sugar transport system substrate-binding protein
MNPGRRSRRTLLRATLIGGTGAFLAACGGGDDSQPMTVAPVTRPDAPAAAPSATAMRGLSGRITVAYADELGKKPPYVDETARLIEQNHPGTSVAIDLRRMGGSEFLDAILPMLASEDAPDVLHASGDRLGELADAGLIAPLDDYLLTWPDWRYYSPTVKDGVTYQGQTWAIPYGLDTRFLYYRRDIFEQVGLSAAWQPKNVADILAAAARVQAQRPDVLPFALYAGVNGGTGSANHGFLPLLHAYGGALKDMRGNWIGDSMAVRKAFAFYAAAYQGQRLVPQSVLLMPRSWVEMRERLGAGRLALLFEGGWVYGGWTAKDKAGTEKNVGYLLFPTETEGPSFTIGGAGTVWYITAASRNRDLAWEYIATWNNRDTVGKLNAEDPHPVARVDSVRVPEYRGDRFLVDSTESLRRAYFTPPDAAYGRVTSVIQSVTAAVASGELTPDQAAARYAAGLREAVGAGKVVLQA